MKYWRHRDLCLIPDFPFHIFYGQFGEDAWEPHAHEFGELVLVVSGRGTHITETGEWPMGPGDIFFIRPDEVHGYRNLHDIHYCNISFDPQTFLEPYPEVLALPGYQALFHVEPELRLVQGYVEKLNLKGDTLQHTVELMGQIRTEYESGLSGREVRVRCMLVLLVTYLARHYRLRQGQGSRAVMNISRVIAFLETKYAEPLALDDLAAAACLSKSSLIRAFNQCFQTSPIRYLNLYRLKQATGLLNETELPIGEIALKVGFSDTNYFSRLFRSVEGMSPRQYRQRTRNAM